MPPLDRRSFLKGAAASAALGVVACGDGGSPSAAVAPPAPAPTTPPSFRHGVASGDPLPDAVVLWTRLSEVSADTPVRWQLAGDQAFTRVVASGSATARADADCTVKVDVPGLAAATAYFYRFIAGEVHSPVGRTRTAPTAAVDALRFAVVTCSDYSRGLYNAYARVAELDDLQAVIHLGDYIYEGGRTDRARPHDPPKEIITLADYRRRYASYRETIELQDVHAAHPMIWVWDDHETANGAWRDGAGNHDETIDGPFAARSAAAVQAALEWLPIRSPDAAQPLRIYRHFSFGPLCDLTMIDSRRIGRDQQGDNNAEQGFVQTGVFADAAREILGSTQQAWVSAQLARPEHSWRLLGNQVVMAPLKIVGAPRATGASVFANPDQWDGYEPARDRFLDAAAAANVQNLVVLTGDVHASMAFEIVRDPNNPASYDGLSGRGSEGVEFVTPSISSAGENEEQAEDPETLVEQLIVRGSEALRATNPQLKLFDAKLNGYLLLTVQPATLRAEYWLVPTVRAVTSAQTLSYAFDVAAGSNTLVEDLAVRAAAPG